MLIYFPVPVLPVDEHERMSELSRAKERAAMDLKHLESDVHLEEEYLACLFHDKHDYSHYLEQ